MSIKRIAASGGDYSTLSSWFAALPATLTEVEIAEVESFDLVDQLYIGGKTQTATEYIEIRPVSGHRHTGIAGSGARIRCGSGATSSTIRIAMPFVRVDGIESYMDKSGSTLSALELTGTFSAGSNVLVNGCIFHDASPSGVTYTILASKANLNLTFTNNVVYGARRTADFRLCASVHLYNNIFWRSAANIGILCDAATTAYNNYSGAAVSGTEDFYTGGTAPTGSYNVSSDATATVDYATGSQINVTGSAVFASLTSGSEDFRPLSGTTALINAGTTIAALTVDAIGVTRPQGASYDVGAFEWETNTGTAYTLTLDAGSYSITGQSILAHTTLSLYLDTGSYSITGQDLSLLQEGSYRLNLEAGTYNIVSEEPNVGISMVLEAGTYTITGSTVRLVSSQDPVIVSKSQPTVSIAIRIGL